MENGKGRILLPTDMVHYMIGSYVLHSIEDKLDRRVEVGEPRDPAGKLEFML